LIPSVPARNKPRQDPKNTEQDAVRDRHSPRNQAKVSLHIEIKTPFEDKALQAVDFISWAIFRKYEYQDGSYYEIIRKKIVEENPLFP